MATGQSHLKIFDEEFCQCPICLLQYREPRLLPCLHRYCSDCLKQLIEENQDTAVLTCPECRDEFPVPTEGVDGFKSDFYMKNIIEYFHLRKSLDDKHPQECCDCSKKGKVVAYCFKCNGYLCKKCYGIHVTKNSLKDHKQHTVSSEDMKSQQMTLDAFADLKEAPKCQSHPEEFCVHCCGTCDNIPICLTCTYGSHENHVINDVSVLAKEERERLTNKLLDLNQYKDRMLQISENMSRVREELISNVEGKRENFHVRYEMELETIKTEIQKMEDKNMTHLAEVENNTKKELTEARKQMDEEIEAIRRKYDDIFEKIKENSDKKLATLKQRQQEKLENSRKKQTFLEREFQTFITAFEERQNDRIVKLQEMSRIIEGTRKRYENLTATADSVLETSNDWTIVHCISDICKATEPLSEDMKREFPELGTLSSIEISPEITDDEKSPVSIEGIKSNEWRITGITSDSSDSVIISGCTPVGYQSHITVINTKGKVIRQEEVLGSVYWPSISCAFLSEFMFATVRDPNEIGLFDSRDGAYVKKKKISDAITSRSPGCRISCVAADPINRHIFVGGDNTRAVHVFDDQLDYLHTLKLPRIIKCPYNMAVSAGNLLVCDFTGKRACVVTTGMTEGGESVQLLHEFTKSNLYGGNWQPLGVCSDKNGFIYILWKTGSYTNERRVVVQYSQDGRQLLRAREIDANDATCIATVKTDTTEKLLVATWNSGKLFIYNIS